MSRMLSSQPPSLSGPAWDIARLFPDQGEWDEWDYLGLSTNHIVEYTDGFVEVLPMPKPPHQRIVLFLYTVLNAFVAARELGEVLVAPMPVKLRPGKFREPDVMLMLAEHSDRKHDDHWDRPDLVMEVVSEDSDSRKRDYDEKRQDYAAAGIPEYWIVDPRERSIAVLRLDDGQYVTDGRYAPGQQAKSVLLAGFAVDVDAVWKAERGQ